MEDIKTNESTGRDANGDYKIRIGRGRYRLIVYTPSPPTYDMIRIRMVCNAKSP